MVDFVYELAATSWSTQLRESLYLYSIIESAHVLGLGLFLGPVFILDFNLLRNRLDGAQVDKLAARLFPFAVVGGVIMFLTGSLLFYSVPIRTFHSLWFRLKLAFILGAAINLIIFHGFTRSRARHARSHGLISLIAWVAVIACGRLIAYGWFDCDQKDISWLRWITQCP